MIGPLNVGARSGAESVAAALATAGGAAKIGWAATPGEGGFAGSFLDALFAPEREQGMRTAEQLGGLLGRFMRTAAKEAFAARSPRGSASTREPHASSSGSAHASGNRGPLAFLKNPKLSVEERLARLMVHLSDKYEKELDKKLQQYAQLESGKGTGGSSRSGGSRGAGGTGGSEGSSRASGFGASAAGQGGEGGALSGFLSGIGGGLFSGDGFKGLLGQLAGPVLAAGATVCGFPMLAPLLSKAGPVLGGLASGALSSSDAADVTERAKRSRGGGGDDGDEGDGERSTRSASGSGGSSSSSSASEKQLMTEIQILQEKQKEMFGLVSNILRSMHDAKMAVVANIR